MNQPRHYLFWSRRLVFLGLGFFLIVAAMLPFNLEIPGWPGPDLLYCLCVAYVIRRPDIGAFWAITALLLLADILHMRPLGLWTLILLLLTEGFRSRNLDFRDMIFPVEWLVVSLGFACALLIEHVILGLALVPNARFLELFKLFLQTVIAYPLIILFLHFVLHIRKYAPGDFDEMGHPV